MKPAIETKTEEVCHLKVGDFVTFDHSANGHTSRNNLAILTRGYGDAMLCNVLGGGWWRSVAVAEQNLSMDEFRRLFSPNYTNITILEPHEVPAAVAKALNVPLVPTPASVDAPSEKERYFVAIDEKGNENYTDLYWVVRPDGTTTRCVRHELARSYSAMRSSSILERVEQPNGFREVPAPPF